MSRRSPHTLDGDLRDRIAARLGEGDLRFTRGREALVTVLALATRPLTIPEICAADDSLAASSAYRNLTGLEAVGVVHRIVTDAEFARYELAEGLTDHHHHHLICSRCGVVDDVEASPSLERAVHDAARAIARRSGFRMERHSVDLIGICANCSRRASSSAR